MLYQKLSATQEKWLNDAIDDIRSNHETKDTHLFYSAMASRQLTSQALRDSPGHWNIDEAARVILLQTCIDSSADNRYDIVWHAYRLGDENEKAAYIKGLSILDPSAELQDIALHTGRTNNVQLFSAIALHNTYPAVHYDDRAFEQLVLKALFLGLNIDHVESLSQRLHTELSNKCMDLVRERLAADREPPVSIWLAIDIRQLDSESQALYLQFLSDPAIEHRYYSLLSLKRLGILDNYPTQLKLRRESETDTAILSLLT